jgi:hypothetical protein
MWIIPKQLHTSAFVADTKALDLDSESFSLLCMKSLTWRGKHSVRRTWSQRWKKVSWLQHLCSRTLEPSHTASFVDAWTSSLEGSLVSHLALLGLNKEWKTLVTCSPTSQEESDSASPQLSFSKMLKESSAPKQPTASQFSDMSCESWNQWVTRQRQDCLQRVKLGRLINGSACLSWATPNTLDHLAQRSPEALQKQFETTRKGRTQPANLREQVHPENWPTATTRMHKGGYQGGRIRNGKVSLDTLDVAVQAYSKGGLLDPTKSSTSGKSHELNPAWVEQLMGIPTGWTDLGSWGTESSHKPQL